MHITSHIRHGVACAPPPQKPPHAKHVSSAVQWSIPYNVQRIYVCNHIMYIARLSVYVLRPCTMMLPPRMHAHPCDAALRWSTQSSKLDFRFSYANIRVTYSSSSVCRTCHERRCCAICYVLAPSLYTRLYTYCKHVFVYLQPEYEQRELRDTETHLGEYYI